MRPDRLQPALLTTASITVGAIGWSGNVLLMPTALLFPLLWAKAQTRCLAGLVSAGYFLAASRGLPQGVASFYATDLWPGLLLWLCASVSFVAVHTALWTKSSRMRPFCYLAAAALMAVPPFGITGWAHPATAAGVLFPGWAWWGLLVVIVGLMGIATRLWPAVAIGFACLWLWSLVHWTNPKGAEGWQGVDLEMGSSLGRDASIERHRALISTVKVRLGETVVLPESALGFWTPTVEQLWVRALQGTTTVVIAGAAMVNEAGYDNVLVAITAYGGSVLYRERMPVPGSMWQPWRSWGGGSGGARAHLFGNSAFRFGDRAVAPLICYEQLVVWPILQSMLHDPDLIVAVGNGWWTTGTSIVEIQRASAISWAKLFAKPIVLSFNT